MTELEQELKRWLESLPFSIYPITMAVSDDPAQLVAYIDSPKPTPLFLLKRVVVVDCMMDIVMGLCLRMINQYRCNFRS